MNKVIDCWDPNCACLIALTPKQEQHYRDKGAVFKCPKGHANVFRPSDMDKLREKVAKLERDVTFLNRRCTSLMGEWKCPYARCYYETRSQGTLVRHINSQHQRKPEALRLPAHAGPDALNSVVH